MIQAASVYWKTSVWLGILLYVASLHHGASSFASSATSSSSSYCSSLSLLDWGALVSSSCHGESALEVLLQGQTMASLASFIYRILQLVYFFFPSYLLPARTNKNAVPYPHLLPLGLVFYSVLFIFAAMVMVEYKPQLVFYLSQFPNHSPWIQRLGSPYGAGLKLRSIMFVQAWHQT